MIAIFNSIIILEIVKDNILWNLTNLDIEYIKDLCHIDNRKNI